MILLQDKIHCSDRCVAAENEYIFSVLVHVQINFVTLLLCVILSSFWVLVPPPQHEI